MTSKNLLMRSLLTIVGGICVFCTVALKAELVILGGGEVIKVAGWEKVDDRYLLELASGGRITLPAARVRRIEPDELRTESAVAATAPNRFLLGFDSSHPVPDTPYGKLIHAAARRHQLNPTLVAAMVRQESGFDPSAVSPRGALGLLQLMPETAQRFGIDAEDLHDPARNLEAGARYLAWLSRHFDGDLDSVLAAFNSGEGTVERYQGVPPYPETRRYIERIHTALGIARAPRRAATSGSAG